MKLKLPYQKHERVSLCFKDSPTLTKQSFKKESDVNHILAKYNKTGVLENVNENKAVYGDFYEVEDYRHSLDVVMASEAHFDALPSIVRTKFDNDPEQFLEFVNDPDNKDEMIELGLMKDPKVQDEILNTKTPEVSDEKKTAETE